LNAHTAPDFLLRCGSSRLPAFPGFILQRARP
jgi:hypothetical protein